MQFVTIALFLGIPLCIAAFHHRIPIVRSVNAIIPAYVAGLVLSFVLPREPGIMAIQDGVSSGMVAVSIPLMLFAVDIRGWIKAGREAIVSLAIATFSVIVSVTVAHLLFRHSLVGSAEVGGLLLGVYTGGTPNLAALRVALGVDNSLYLTVHTVDLMVSAVYILVILLLGRAFIARFGRRREAVTGVPASIGVEEIGFGEIVRVGNRRTSALALGSALIVVALSVGVSLIVPTQHQTVVTILALTTFALAATAIPGIGSLHTSFVFGKFFILVFSVAVGSMADIERMLAASPAIVAYMAIVVFGSLSIHIVLGRLARVRTAVIMATSVSAVCSPPFVGMLAPIVRDPQIIAAGITTGIIGYAIGNYLGVIAAWLLGMI